jgi:myo-inositol-1(or 4)-monophosphatase
MLNTALECADAAGHLLLDRFGQVQDIRIKDSRSSIVTEADLASDRLLRGLLTTHYPEHNLLTEEYGFERRGSRFTWVVDPLDGTSNFAAGIPWFGVMLALLDGTEPIVGVLHLPVEGSVYAAELGSGTRRNGQLVHVTRQSDLGSVLCAFGMDAAAEADAARDQALALSRVLQRVRNLRATNSLVDFALTIDGRLGACVNFHTMLWDIAAPCLLLQEAGGRFTDHRGLPLEFSLADDACHRPYAVAGGNPALHEQLVPLLDEPGP